MKHLYIVFVVAILVLTAMSTSFGQMPDHLQLRLIVENAGTIDTSWFGIGVGGTRCIDTLFHEEERPPLPPAGVMDVRFTETSCLGQGLKTDIQAGSNSAAVTDTFKCAFQLVDPDQPTVVRWAHSLNGYATAARAVGQLNAFNIDMMTVDTLLIDGGSGLSFFRLFVTWRAINHPEGVQQQSNVPATFALNQNYPNPFNPTTTIAFAIEKVSVTDISVYNVLGQKVASLVGQQMSPGTYTTRWNGVDDHGMSVSSGVYFVRMNAAYGNGENFTQMRKIVLMK